MIYAHPAAYCCPDCEQNTAFLFEDGKCKNCTSVTASRIVEALPEVEEINAHLTVVFATSELQLKARNPGVIGVRKVKEVKGLWTGTVITG